MSHIKQSGQPMPKRPGVKASQLSDQSANSVLHSVPLDRSRPGDAQRVIRPVSTRNDAEPNHTGKTQPRGGVSHRNGDSTSLLKRSLSKLRLNDATSPNRQKPPQATRQHLAPASRIPQATSPASCTRIISDHPDRSAFVFHSLGSPDTKPTSASQRTHLQPTSPRQADHHHDRYGTSPPGSTLIPKPSPAAANKAAQVRMKAMQLGIFKISEPDLKERYQFLNEIGAGEWGSVWSVSALKPLDHLPTSAYRSLQVVKLTGSGTYTIDNTPNFRPLAVKLCKRETKYASAAMTQRLWNEFKTLRMLMDQLPRAEQVNSRSPNCRVRNDRTGWHPNVVNFYEFLLTPTLAMLVMPKFDEPMKVCLGETLCINFFQQLLSALHWLHQHGVCHNDIKVNNLGVTYDTSGLGRDIVTLFDFGFANRYNPIHKDAFMSKDVWGTPEYLSPERCRAAWHDERKSDIWALGITFFEMLTGRTPFEHHDEKFDSKEKFEIYYARAERGVWLGDWQISPGLEDVIRGMLHHNPRERIDAGGALLSPLFDPQNSTRCDSFDELLRMSYDDDQVQQVTRDPRLSPDVIELHQDLDDSDAAIHDLVEQTQLRSSRHDDGDRHGESLLASPGISRAAVLAHHSHAPCSPSLSQVGMDSRLTDLMCVSPPWRKGQPPRKGTPIPSAQRDRVWTSKLAEAEDDDESDASASDHSPVAITNVCKAQPAKQSPFRLRLGEWKRASGATRTLQERMASTPLSAPAAIVQRTDAPLMQPTLLPPVDGEKSKSTATRIESGSRGNVVASLAKKFDASNYSTGPPPLTSSTGLGLIVRGQSLAKNGPGHRRSKSHTLMGSEQQGLMPRASRRSTGSYVPSPEDALPRCARRLFDVAEPNQPQVEMDNVTDIGSARSDTKDAGVPPVQPLLPSSAAANTPSFHTALAGDPPNPTSATPTSSTSGGEEVIVRRLKKMASLAGLLTKMIDETKSTIMSPEVEMKTPMRRKGSSGTVSTEALDISPGLLGAAVEERRGGGEGDVSMVSAAYSLDLSGHERDTAAIPVQDRHTQQHGRGGSTTFSHPSPAQVETMYSSFLLSQNVSKAGSGFLSPAQPTAGAPNCPPGKNKHRSLAALFSPSNSNTALEQLLQDGASPQKPKRFGGGDHQRSVGKGGKLARLFRKQL